VLGLTLGTTNGWEDGDVLGTVDGILDIDGLGIINDLELGTTDGNELVDDDCPSI